MTEQEVVRFVYHEARLLDEQRWDEWFALFAADGLYWVPLTRGQTEGEEQTSLAYEDTLLLRLRIERLRRHPPSQQPASFSQHVLQAPEVAAAAAGVWRTRTAFSYAEARGDEMLMLFGVAIHDLVEDAGGLRIRCKRVELLNCAAALPSVQLFL